MQELVDDTGSIRVSPNIQHTVGYDHDKAEENSKKVYEVKFGQVYLSKPTNVEKDQSVSNIFPHEARCVWSVVVPHPPLVPFSPLARYASLPFQPS